MDNTSGLPAGMTSEYAVVSNGFPNTETFVSNVSSSSWAMLPSLSSTSSDTTGSVSFNSLQSDLLASSAAKRPRQSLYPSEEARQAARELQKARRREQNRNAQRRLRDRKEEHIFKLEGEVSRLQRINEQQQASEQCLERLLRRLLAERDELQQRLESISPGSAAIALSSSPSSSPIEPRISGRTRSISLNENLLHDPLQLQSYHAGSALQLSSLHSSLRLSDTISSASAVPEGRLRSLSFNQETSRVKDPPRHGAASRPPTCWGNWQLDGLSSFPQDGGALGLSEGPSESCSNSDSVLSVPAHSSPSDLSSEPMSAPGSSTGMTMFTSSETTSARMYTQEGNLRDCNAALEAVILRAPFAA